MNPKISIVMPTKQGLYPMRGKVDLDIFDLLLLSLEAQTFKDFELIIVDYYYKDKERQKRFKDHRFDFPIKYIPQRPSMWDDIKKAPQISLARNSGIVFAKGKITICIDDCIRMDTKNLLEQIWWWWENYGLVLRPLVDNSIPRNQINNYNKDADSKWIEDLPDYLRFKELNAHRGNVYSYPTEAYLDLNGFDERFDGGWGSEDCDFSKRLDIFGMKRFVLKENHERFVRVDHNGFINAVESATRCVQCNEAYAQWKYPLIEKGMLVANSSPLSEEQIKEIQSVCKSDKCPLSTDGSCKRDKIIDPQYYRIIQPSFNMREDRLKMLARHGDKVGPFDPW